MAKMPEDFEIKIRADVTQMVRQLRHAWWKMFWYEYGPLIIYVVGVLIVLGVFIIWAKTK